MKYLFVFSLFVLACGDNVKAPNGESCDKSSECESRLCLQELNGPFGPAYPLDGGLCTDECMWDFSAENFEDKSTGTCESGQVCLQYAGGDQVCFLRCEENTDCRESWGCVCVSYDCSSSDAVSVCLPE